MKPQEASSDCLTLNTRFNGVLDGQGHTIYNLYCDRCSGQGLPVQHAVGVVGLPRRQRDYANGGNGEKTEAEFENGWQPAVRTWCWAPAPSTAAAWSAASWAASVRHRTAL